MVWRIVVMDIRAIVSLALLYVSVLIVPQPRRKDLADKVKDYIWLYQRRVM